MLSQALHDAAGLRTAGTSAGRQALERRRVAIWIDTPDFIEVCDLAGVEPAIVRARIEAALRGVR